MTDFHHLHIGSNVENGQKINI